jgi:hypothetical protein
MKFMSLNHCRKEKGKLKDEEHPPRDNDLEGLG